MINNRKQQLAASRKSAESNPASLPTSSSSNIHRYGRGGNLFPSSQASRPGMPTSFHTISPEDFTGEDYSLTIEDVISSGTESVSGDEEVNSDDNDVNTGRTSSMFGITDPPVIESERQPSAVWSEDEEYQASRQLTTLLGFEESDEELEVTSEEERDIVKEIRDEITNKVKAEMRGELALMDLQRHARDKKDTKHDDLADVEPKLKEAILKMRKLDRILIKKLKKEKKVKRDRISLEKRLKEELDELKKNKKEPLEEKRNTEKFLALTLPPSHNIGCVDANEMSPPVTPVFQTQFLDGAEKSESNKTNSKDNDDGDDQSSMTSEDDANSSKSTVSKDGKNKDSKNKKDKDFIKRNIQLAANAGDTVAMTEEEKNRIDGLLQDLESLPDIPEEGATPVEEDSNPYQIVLSSGEGFLPTAQEMKRLDEIDNRLKALLPPDDYESISSSARSYSSRQSVLFSRTHLPSSLEIDQLGEEALKETKEKRDIRERLRDVEIELKQLTSGHNIEIEQPQLSDDQLQDLLEECARTMSRATTDRQSIDQSSTRCSSADTQESDVAMDSIRSIYDDPPKLPDDVLQQLLADARQELCGRQQLGDTETPECVSHHDKLVLESLTEEQIDDLMQDSQCSSRASTRRVFPCHSSRSAISNGRDQEDEHPAECRRPFLPAIDQTGMLSTQKPNNQILNNEECTGSRINSAGRIHPQSVWNSQQETANYTSVLSRDSDSDPSPCNTPIPCPPSSGRRSGSGHKHRTASPRSKNCLD